jgi:hypothetical protein
MATLLHHISVPLPSPLFSVFCVFLLLFSFLFPLNLLTLSNFSFTYKLSISLVMPPHAILSPRRSLSFTLLSRTTHTSALKPQSAVALLRSIVGKIDHSHAQEICKVTDSLELVVWCAFLVLSHEPYWILSLSHEPYWILSLSPLSVSSLSLHFLTGFSCLSKLSSSLSLSLLCLSSLYLFSSLSLSLSLLIVFPFGCTLTEPLASLIAVWIHATSNQGGGINALAATAYHT